MFSVSDGVTDMPLLQKLRLFPKWQRVTLQMTSVTACNFCFLSRDQEQQLNHQKHHLSDKAEWPLSVLSLPQIWLLKRLTKNTVLMCKMLVGLPGAAQLWNEDYSLHLLWGCSSATIKCCHVMKGKAAGHLRPLISMQHVLHNAPSSLLCTNPSSLLHCLLLRLSSSLIPQLRFSSCSAIHRASSCTLSLLSIFLLLCH